MSDLDPELRAQLEKNPEPLMASMTTEHFTLAGARSQTVTEANGRASIFLAVVSSGLVALGFLGPSGETFEIFVLVLFPALVFLGLVTFDRVLENSIEDIGYARRIELCRRFYANAWPMLAPYLYRPELEEEAIGQRSRLKTGWQLFLTVSGVVAVLTSVLLGAFAGVIARVLAGGSVGVSFAVGGLAVAAAVALLHTAQRRAFRSADFTRIDPQFRREGPTA